MGTHWKGAIRRSNSSDIRKEEIIPITLKVTKREPYFDWTIHQLRFCNNKESYTLRIPFKSWFYDYDIAYYLEEQGVDIKCMNTDMWKEFCSGGNRYHTFREWVKNQWEEAKAGGSSHLRYTYRKRHLDGIWWEVKITLHMFGETRNVWYVASCRYETTPSEETIHNYVFDLLREQLPDYYVSSKGRFILSKEEWDNNDTFKELYENGRKAIEGYNSGELQRNSW